MSLSTRVRFEVFKRDGFVCVYCGADPTTGPLHVDHVEPTSKGGTDEPGNLVTSCADCNLGKSNVLLSDTRYRRRTADDVRDQAEQIDQYLIAQKQLVAAKGSIVSAIEELWEPVLGCGFTLAERTSVEFFLRELPFDRVVEAMNMALGRLGGRRSKSQVFRYFCGIAHKWRRDAQDEDS